MLPNFRDWPIRTKLGFGFGVLMAIAIIIAWMAIQTSNRYKELLGSLHDDLLQNIIYLTSLHDLALDHNRDLYALLLQGHDDDERIHQHLLIIEEQIRQSLRDPQRNRLAPAESMQLSTFERQWQRYLILAGEVLELHEAGEDDQAQGLVETLEPLFLTTEEILLQLVDLNSQNAHRIVNINRKLARDFIGSLTIGLALALCLALLLALRCSRAIVEPIRLAAETNNRLARQGTTQIELARAIADGDLEQTIPEPTVIDIPPPLVHAEETGDLLRSARLMSESQATLTRAMRKMVDRLRTVRDREQRRDWLKSGLNSADHLLRGEKSVEQLTGDILPFLVTYLGASVGALYLYDPFEEQLIFQTGWGSNDSTRAKPRLALGEGLLGQAVRDGRRLRIDDMPADYLPVGSAFGEIPSCQVIIQPLLHEQELFGAIELGSLRAFSEESGELLEQVAENLALALKIARSRSQISDLLDQSQQQTEELRVQQEELQQSNEELEERAQLLEQQREQIGTQKRDLERTSEELRDKAEELARISAYKSEFLANMSHELRSPLNSLLILSSLLRENRDGNLNDKQVKFATTIHTAGQDLLTLINDILDLSKVEAGHLQLHYDSIPVDALCDELLALCQPQFAAKNLELSLAIDTDAAREIDGDRQRLQQILRNLLINACKFTDQGEVILRVRPLAPGEGGVTGPGLAFVVRDTGIGIAPDKQRLIFEAFQQADGSTSRKYGGTGLGLSIALQLARRMGGDIRLESAPGAGSTFILCLPLQRPAQALTTPPQALSAATTAEPQPAAVSEPAPAPVDALPQPLPDDRLLLQSEDRAILIIEDDLDFGRLLLDMVRSRHFKTLFAADGETGLTLAEHFQPSAILLDVMLPRIDGWAVMRRLKESSRTRHIPVHFISCLDEEHKALGMGAIGYLRKPVTAEQLAEVFGTLEESVDKTVKRLLIVEDNPVEADAMVELLGERHVEIDVVPGGKAAIDALASARYDCIVLDLGLSDTTGFTLLEHLRSHDELRRIPVIIHSGQEISREDELRLRRYTESIIIKGTRSPSRLLNEVTLFLHLVASGLPPDKQEMIRTVLDKEALLEGKQILIVDDDMRNIFSLSNILSDKGLIIHEAENGREALRQLDEHTDIDLVLMDIMMPEMDGYAAIRAIRQNRRLAQLPIIAMTAKALKGDREKCLEAGASDYLSKPIDPVKLISLLRVWLYPGNGAT
ncbi:MAG: response regulator [Desulfuromonadales bacterium]|nr:response regulator [Desulfuromonadales bacterium]